MKQKIKNLHKIHKKYVIGATIFAGLLVVIFAQLMYPYEKLLPFTRIADTSVSGWRAADVIDGLHGKYSALPLTLRIPNADPIQTTTAKVGITPNYQQALDQAYGYSLGERLIPFSFIYKTLQYRSVALSYSIDEEILNQFMVELASKCNIAPVDAGLELKGENVALVEAKSGQRCEMRAVKNVLQGHELTNGGLKVNVGVTTITPARTNEQVQTQLTKVQSIIDNGLTIASLNEQWSVPKEVIVSWLDVVEADGQLLVQANQEEIKKYLDNLKGSLYVEPGITRIVLRDGIEINRQQGEQGQGIDSSVTAERVTAALLGTGTDKTAWVKLAVLEPTVSYDVSYSSSNAGLQALLEQWDRNNYGQYGIVVQDLSGKDISASLNPDADFVTASTYKMFLAYAVLHKVEAGEISMETRTDTGLSVRACIDEMILNSTNFCATALFNLVGYRDVHDFVQAQGFKSTILDNDLSTDGDKHTTARDEANFLNRLNNGSLLNKDNTSYLLGLMKRQIYRSGIPSGVPGVSVANKVGFYNGYKHDVAIIYAPRGTYVLTILSHGGSDARISDLSRRIAELMD